MKIIVWANTDQQSEILLKETNKDSQIVFAESFSTLINQKNVDAYFILKDDIEIPEVNTFTSKPVFINSVIETLKESGLSKNVSRIIGWPTFLLRDTWEIATQNEEIVKTIFNSLLWKYLFVKDEPGFIAARIVSMIINEGFYALGDEVSTREEIDVAMKLGTNYPFGPFEWGEKIGLKNIAALLAKLSENDHRYNIAPYLEKQFNYQQY